LPFERERRDPDRGAQLTVTAWARYDTLAAWSQFVGKAPTGDNSYGWTIGIDVGHDFLVRAMNGDVNARGWNTAADSTRSADRRLELPHHRRGGGAVTDRRSVPNLRRASRSGCGPTAGAPRLRRDAEAPDSLVCGGGARARPWM
jgi:hypothetical protein